jgi:hypothetical protein
MSGLGVLSVLPEDIWEKILQEMEKTLTMLKVSKEMRRLLRRVYAPWTMRQDHQFMYAPGTIAIEHMKGVLRCVTRLLREYKFKIEGAQRSWSYSLYVCKHHGDCGHQAGHLFDLLELRDLVLACPGFKLHYYGHAPEPDDVYFTLVLQSYNADAWRVQLNLTRNPERLVVEPLTFGWIQGDFFE